MSDTTKTTVYLDADDYQRLKQIARAQGKTTAQVVREAVAVYAVTVQPPVRPASVGAGRSGRGDLAERAEELLAGFGRKGGK
jgi:predicted transcriptional regulator